MLRGRLGLFAFWFCVCLGLLWVVFLVLVGYLWLFVDFCCLVCCFGFRCWGLVGCNYVGFLLDLPSVWLVIFVLNYLVWCDFIACWVCWVCICLIVLWF